MNVLVLNSSPKAEEFSVTQILTREFVKGLLEAGATVDTYNLNKLNIKHCMDCGSCATKSPGKCVMKDDMTEILFPKFLEADALVLATPIYFGMVNAVMKNFIERLFPYLGPFQEVQGKGVLQRFRGEFPKIVVISAASWHYSHIFKPMSDYFQYLFEDKLVGELYRGSSDSFLYGAMFYEKKQEILLATRQAGVELVKDGFVQVNTVQAICQDVGQLEKTVIMHNLSMKLCKEENVNTVEFAKERLKDHGAIIPKTIDSFQDAIRLLFEGDTQEENFSVQIHIKGKEKKEFYFQIENGSLQIEDGKLEKSDLTLKGSFENFVDAFFRKRDILQHIMQGKIIVKGNMSLCEKLQILLFQK